MDHFVRLRFLFSKVRCLSCAMVVIGFIFSCSPDRAHNDGKSVFNDSLDGEVKHQLAKVRYSQLQLPGAIQDFKQSLLSILVPVVIIILFVLFGVLINRKKLVALNVKITAQNQGLKYAIEVLQQSQDENTRIMKRVAHDLRSPMAATVSLASLMLETSELNDENKELLALMKDTNLRALDMVEDLLNINIVFEGLKMSPVSIHSVLEYCVNMLSFKTNEKQQKIILNTVEIMLPANRQKLWRLFGNLIGNAIKFSPPGSIINVDVYKNENAVQIRIKDKGIGIPDELQGIIFDLFTEAKREGTGGEASFGLGLAISRQIVEAHHGKIWFETEQNVGTTFYIEFPNPG